MLGLVGVVQFFVVTPVVVAVIVPLTVATVTLTILKRLAFEGVDWMVAPTVAATALADTSARTPLMEIKSLAAGLKLPAIVIMICPPAAVLLPVILVAWLSQDVE